MENQSRRKSDLGRFGWIISRKNKSYWDDGSTVIRVFWSKEISLPFVNVVFARKDLKVVALVQLDFLQILKDSSCCIR
jgi:hypothetical protein